MKLTDYIKNAESICEREFMCGKDLVHELDIAYNTLLRAKRNPEKCSMNTAKKIKKFVDDWQNKNIVELLKESLNSKE